MMDSLFHEIHGVYFAIVETMLKQQKPLTSKELEQIVAAQGFGETALKLLPSIKNQVDPWYLLMKIQPDQWGRTTHQAPPLVHTLLERRWLKTVLTDPRLPFFLEEAEIQQMEAQLKDVEPLFDLDSVVYFDQFQQPTSDALEKRQAKFFKQLIAAIQQKSR